MPICALLAGLIAGLIHCCCSAIARSALSARRCVPPRRSRVPTTPAAMASSSAREPTAVKRVFGEGASALPMSSIKSMIGHLIGAAGAVEAAALALTLNDGVLPPTINYSQRDPLCDLDYVPNTAREIPVRVGLSTS